ncbi:hypothetical protein [Treponema endosymbiont of Eucomonympha sp.]|uniref:hypothetical protein n=1 Tax=Treponema endosymbiont of Eucomonympha sp. TaxID=1580831 RepID=UPI000751122B|nr:hypothetical protein [Treponema endosymbiont of Eucomonympha sp.]
MLAPDSPPTKPPTITLLRWSVKCSLKKWEHEEPNPQVQTVIARQIGAIDRQVDEAVYRLYGLMAEEIKRR